MACKDILEQGVFRIVQFDSYLNTTSRYFEWIKSLDQSDARKATDAGIDLTIPVEGVQVPLGINFSDNQWNTWSAAREKLVESSISVTQVISAFQRTADPVLVAAWSKCMTEEISAGAKAAGLQLEMAHLGNGVIKVSLEFKIAGGGVDANVINYSVKNAQITGGEIPKVLKANTPTVLMCDWLDQSAIAAFSINTDRGAPLDFVEPAKAPPPPIIKKKLGANYGGANNSPLLSATVDTTQEVRVFGGCVAKYESPGNPNAQGWLQVDTPATGSHRPWDVSVFVADPDPQVTLFGQSFTGTLVGQFDYRFPMQAGETLTCQIFTKNERAKASGLVLRVEYVGKESDPKALGEYMTEVLAGRMSSPLIMPTL